MVLFNATPQTIVGKNFSTGWWLGLDSGIIRYYTNGALSRSDGTRVLPLNTWSHVAVTFDGTIRRYYIDGILDHEETTPTVRS